MVNSWFGWPFCQKAAILKSYKMGLHLISSRWSKPNFMQNVVLLSQNPQFPHFSAQISWIIYDGCIDIYHRSNKLCENNVALTSVEVRAELTSSHWKCMVYAQPRGPGFKSRPTTFFFFWVAFLWNFFLLA